MPSGTVKAISFLQKYALIINQLSCYMCITDNQYLDLFIERVCWVTSKQMDPKFEFGKQCLVSVRTFGVISNIIYMYLNQVRLRKKYAPHVRPDQGSNSWPPDHDNRAYISCHWDACSNHLAISDYFRLWLDPDWRLNKHCHIKWQRLNHLNHI